MRRGRLRKATLARRMDEVEATLGGEPRCRCGLPSTAPLWARAIALKSPDDFPATTCSRTWAGRWFGRIVYEPCPDCGRERLVYVTHWLVRQ